MCPDEQLLSAYVDKELPEAWMSRVKEHLAGCEKCAGTVADFQSLRKLLADTDILIPESIAEKAFHDVKTRKTAEGHRFFIEGRVTLPAPIAAAAAFLVLAALGILMFGGRGSSTGTLATAEETILLPEEQNIRSLEEAIRVFESQNANIEIYIQLPERTDYFRIGEPVLIREAELRQGPR